jgi:hypothetical protein
MLWRYRGTPHYLRIQAQAMRIAQVLADRARNNPEIYRVSVLLAQLCERYHKARKEDGKPVFGVVERGQVQATLGQCELELQKLHMLSAAAEAMLAEAYEAFNFSPPRRPFAVLSDTPVNHHDTPLVPLPLGDGTVGIGDDDAEPAASCVDQWPAAIGT